jgi:hypothetical protein
MYYTGANLIGVKIIERLSSRGKESQCARHTSLLLWRRLRLGKKGKKRRKKTKILIILPFPTYRPKHNLNLHPQPHHFIYLASPSTREGKSRSVHVMTLTSCADFPIKQRPVAIKGFQRLLQLSIKFLLVLVSTNILKQQGSPLINNTTLFMA